jgi:hypothetical protein
LFISSLYIVVFSLIYGKFNLRLRRVDAFFYKLMLNFNLSGSIYTDTRLPSYVFPSFARFVSGHAPLQNTSPPLEAEGAPLKEGLEKIYIYFFSRGPHTKLFGLIIRKDGIILVALSSQSAPHR